VTATGPTGKPEGSVPGTGTSSTLAWLLSLAAAGAIAYFFRTLAVPFLLAALLAYLLNPPIAWAQGFGIRRSVAVSALFAAIGLILVLVGAVVIPRVRSEAVTLVSNLPELSGRLERVIDDVSREVRASYPRLRRFLPADEKPGWLQRRMEEQVGGVSEVASHLGATAIVVILVPIFAFFLLRDAGRMLGSLLDRLHPAHIETSVAVWYEIDRIIGRYLRGLALDGIVVGIVAALGLWLLGVPYPLLLGAFTALVNPLPYVGTILSVAAAAVAALTSGQGLGTVGWILALYAVIRLLDDLVISVVTIGGSVHLHPALVIASIVAGEHALGMVIAVPVVTVLKETARLLLEHRRTLARTGLPRVTPVGPTHYVC